jgi:hypothetical protein
MISKLTINEVGYNPLINQLNKQTETDIEKIKEELRRIVIIFTITISPAGVVRAVTVAYPNRGDPRRECTHNSV